MQQSLHNPYGGPAALVDKMIGTSYEVVRFVSFYVPQITYVAEHMESIVKSVNNIKDNALVIGKAGLPGEVTTVPLPPEVLPGNILSSSVMLMDSEQNLYGYETGYFTYLIQEGELRLTLRESAPAKLGGSTIRWFLTFGVINGN